MGGFFMADELFNATEDNFLPIGAAMLMRCTDHPPEETFQMLTWLLSFVILKGDSPG